MTTTTDYLGTLAVNLRLAAEAAEELREVANADVRVAMGLEHVNAMTLALEDRAIAYRCEINRAHIELYKARSAARIAIDAAQAARRGARCHCPENESPFEPKHRGECGFFGTTPNPDCRCHNAPFPVVQEARL